MLFIAATMSVLAAQRFGEEFGVWDRVGTCPIPTLASKCLAFNYFRLNLSTDIYFFFREARDENRPSPFTIPQRNARRMAPRAVLPASLVESQKIGRFSDLVGAATL
jgi:hypothetical protein